MAGKANMERVGFSRRFKATALDGAAILIIGCLAAWFYRHFFWYPVHGTSGGLILPDLAVFLAALAVYALVEGLLGRSPGKMVNHIIVRTSGGEPADLFTLLFRSFLKHSMFLVPLIVVGTFIFMKIPTPAVVARYTQTLLGMILIQLLLFLVLAMGVAMFNGCFLVLTQNRQSLHDRLADTAVYSGHFRRNRI